MQQIKAYRQTRICLLLKLPLPVVSGKRILILVFGSSCLLALCFGRNNPVELKPEEQLVQAPRPLLELAQPVELLPVARRPLLRAAIRLKGLVRARLAPAGLVSLSVLADASVVRTRLIPELVALLEMST
jgi:hypothetical protein